MSELGEGMTNHHASMLYSGWHICEDGDSSSVVCDILRVIGGAVRVDGVVPEWRQRDHEVLVMGRGSCGSCLSYLGNSSSVP